jgi:NADH:ubiquinone oxidoreductase subunit 6 (subunit J)
LSSVLMITCINPINAVLFLISTFISVAMIFLMWNIEFLALVFIIVYVGAIAVLFLFIVMMINVKRIEKDNTTYLTIGILIILLFFFQLLLLVFNPAFEYTNNFSFIDYFYFIKLNKLDEIVRIFVIRDMGIVLFYVRPLLLLLAGFILLVAMVASIFLTNLKRGFSMKKQFNQLSKQYRIRHVGIY